MRSLAARSIMTVSAALTFFSTAACQPMAARAGEPIHCNVMLDPPTRDDPQAPKRIVSQVRFWCEDPGADKLALTLRMQKQDAKGNWVDVAKTSFTATGNQTVRTDDLRYRNRTVSIRCAGGNYRTSVTGSSSGKSTMDTTYDLTGARSADPCTPSLAFT